MLRTPQIFTFLNRSLQTAFIFEEKNLIEKINRWKIALLIFFAIRKISLDFDLLCSQKNKNLLVVWIFLASTHLHSSYVLNRNTTRIGVILVLASSVFVKFENRKIVFWTKNASDTPYFYVFEQISAKGVHFRRKNPIGKINQWKIEF